MPQITSHIRELPPGFWASVAETKWGRYITANERDVLAAVHARFPSPGDAVDVGCGEGRWTAFVAERGWSVTAIDVDPVAIAASAEVTPSARYVLVDPKSKALPVDDASADLAMCIEVKLMHEPWLMAEFARVLRPGGVVVGIAWNTRSFRGLIARAKATVTGSGRHPYYAESYGSLVQRLGDAGFAVQSERGLCWFPFGRASNSPLVPAAVAVEQRLGLQRFPRSSPWVLFTAKRT